MKFPDRPTCHDGPGQNIFRFGETVWRPPQLEGEPYQYPFRACNYCGSIHPEDLLKYLETGTVGLDGCDWKYGWPHKFYVEGIPNPLAGRQVQIGSSSWVELICIPCGFTLREDKIIECCPDCTNPFDRSRWRAGKRHEDAIVGEASPFTHTKWYNAHLADDGYDQEALERLTKALYEHSKISWELTPQGLMYRAPYAGYQHVSPQSEARFEEVKKSMEKAVEENTDENQDQHGG